MTAQGHNVIRKADHWEYKHSASQSENIITGTIGQLTSNSGNLLVTSFSPNCVFGNQPRGITLQRAFADLEHGGDLKAATSEIHDLEPVDEFTANIDTSVFINSSDQKNEHGEASGNSSNKNPKSEPFSSNHTWEKLEPLRQAEELPEFPVDALPPSLSDWVSQESEATQTPPDMAALLAIAVCAVPLAKRVEVLAWEPWVEPTNLYVATILEPANRKSAVFKDAQKPLRQVERELIKQEAPEKVKELSRQRAKRLRLKKLEKTAAEDPSAKKRDEAQREADELSVEVAAFLPIEETTLIVDDVTSEKLAVMMQANGERIASMSAEGEVFALMKGRYSCGQTDIGIYLKGHSGDSVSVDRVIRGPVKLDAPALTMAIAIQPEVIRGIAGNSAFRGRGLLGRFLYAVPRSWVGNRNIAPEPVARLVSVEYGNAVKDLADIELNSEGQPHRIKLSSEAVDTFKEFNRWIESELKAGSLEDMKDWGGKLAGVTLRIAGILHCVERGTQGVAEDIGVETIENAQRIAEWAIPHAAAAFDLLQVTENDLLEDAEYLLRWFRKEHQPDGTFSRRDAQRSNQRRFNKDPDRLSKVLNLLEQTNHIRPLDAPRTGGHKSYAISPACF
ncbi:YfjI family protein [bacterium]|nr:YfjI family protein [bacterium]